MENEATPAHQELRGRVAKDVAEIRAIQAVKAFAKENDLTVDEALEQLEEAMCCEGHESIGGPIGSVTFCDGSCR